MRKELKREKLCWKTVGFVCVCVFWQIPKFDQAHVVSFSALTPLQGHAQTVPVQH